ncbi:MAG TPA: hypothetical protein DEH78_24020 [Solibacterales bacterium]|nr:hypothetical protein [Bryobacterales bacterium]
MRLLALCLIATALSAEVRTVRLNPARTAARTEFAFRAAGLYPPGPKARVRVSTDGLRWSDWTAVERESEDSGAFVFFDQPQRWIEVDPPSAVLLIDPGVSPALPREKRAPPSAATETPRAVSRTEWGCPPETCFFRGGSPAYATVTHLVVHHTAGANSASDWPAVVRSIWTLHVVGNGWSDIGYNYLIDPNGVLYEGRQGGDGVIGAHFSGVNTGTMGVSVIGTYSTLPPSEAALRTLTQMLAWHANRWTLDPAGEALHAASQLRLNVIGGHRDAGLSPRASGGTECPGNGVYASLHRLRSDVNRMLRGECALRVVAPRVCFAAEGGSVALTVEAPAGCLFSVESRDPWIAAAPDGRLTIAANGGARRSGTVSIAGQDLLLSQAAAGEGPLPCPLPRGIVSAGAVDTRPVVNGSLVSIYGSDLASAAEAAPDGTLPTSLAGVSVLVNGARALPLLFVSPGQINAQLPTGINTGSARLTVTAGGVRGPESLFWITEAAPALFLAQNHEDGRANTADTPVRAGSPLIVYLTGGGPVAGALPAAGTPNPWEPAAIRLPWSVRIGSRAVEGLYLGLTPGFAGLYQANVIVPPDLAAGEHRLTVTVAGSESAPVTVFVR